MQPLRLATMLCEPSPPCVYAEAGVQSYILSILRTLPLPSSSGRILGCVCIMPRCGLFFLTFAYHVVFRRGGNEVDMPLLAGYGYDLVGKRHRC